MKAEPESHRLVLENYAQLFHTDTRYSDLDSYAHLNNNAIGRLYEDSRARLNMSIFQDPKMFRPDALERLLLAETRLRYLKEGYYPAPVSIGSAIGRLGNSSFDIHQALFQHNVCIGLCDVTMVYTRDGRPSAIQGELRQRFEAMLITAD